MKWTAEPPTEPGYYLYRDARMDGWIVVDVFRAPGGQMCGYGYRHRGRGHVVIMGELADMFRGEWCKVEAPV